MDRRKEYARKAGLKSCYHIEKINNILICTLCTLRTYAVPYTNVLFFSYRYQYHRHQRKLIYISGFRRTDESEINTRDEFYLEFCTIRLFSTTCFLLTQPEYSSVNFFFFYIFYTHTSIYHYYYWKAKRRYERYVGKEWREGRRNKEVNPRRWDRTTWWEYIVYYDYSDNTIVTRAASETAPLNFTDLQTNTRCVPSSPSVWQNRGEQATHLQDVKSI